MVPMTEEEWLSFSGEPTKLLDHLGSRVSKRKRRLFACACLRRVWHLIEDERSRSAVLLAERFADGLATTDELIASQPEMRSIAEEQTRNPDRCHATAWGCWCVLDEQAGSAVNARFHAVHAIQWHTLGEALRHGLQDTVDERQAIYQRAGTEEHRSQCQLFRDIFGNPFRPLPPKTGKRHWEEAKAAWLQLNGGTVLKLAEVIYASRQFQDLPILADALEESGCTEASILAHCRSRDEHVLGCWVVDLLLGKA
jgi:hypothetical protein